MSNWMRQFHRWVSLAFTLGVIVNIVANLQKQQAGWIFALALVPLALLLLTGTWLFFRPYVLKLRRVHERQAA
jgi:uncharacterized protein (DUF58 family)